MTAIAWKSGIDGDWSTGVDWTGGGVPGQHDKLAIGARPLVRRDGASSVRDGKIRDNPRLILVVDGAMSEADIPASSRGERPAIRRFISRCPKRDQRRQR